MEKFELSLDKAKKGLDSANHMINITLPVIKENRFLIKIDFINRFTWTAFHDPKGIPGFIPLGCPRQESGFLTKFGCVRVLESGSDEDKRCNGFCGKNCRGAYEHEILCEETGYPEDEDQ